MVLHEAKQLLRTSLLLRPCIADPRTLKIVFSRSNFSDNYVQVLRSKHSNVQLLYLLLLFAVVLSVVVLTDP